LYQIVLKPAYYKIRFIRKTKALIKHYNIISWY